MNALVVLVLIVGSAALGWLVWSYLQQNAKLLATRTVEFAEGLRFEAHTFSVEMHQTTQCVKVRALQGTLQVTALQEGGSANNQGGVYEFCLPTTGLGVELVPTPVAPDAGPAAQARHTFDIVFKSSGEHPAEPDTQPEAQPGAEPDAQPGKNPGEKPGSAGPARSSVLRLNGLPAPVARNFQAFASRLTIWADKVTRFAAQDKAQAEQAARDAAAAALEALAQPEAAQAAHAAAAAGADETTDSLDLAAQIAQWRKTAGFSGQHSEVGTHDKGGINWFIDLDPAGRITLHGHKRTVFTTLQGASITALPKAIEIGVRDEFWSEGDPLLVFQVLQGSPPNERRQWQEWLQAARNRSDISALKGY